MKKRNAARVNLFIATVPFLVFVLAKGLAGRGQPANALSAPDDFMLAFGIGITVLDGVTAQAEGHAAFLGSSLVDAFFGHRLRRDDDLHRQPTRLECMVWRFGRRVHGGVRLRRLEIRQGRRLMIASIIVFWLSVAGLVVIIVLNRLPEPSLVDDRYFEPQPAGDRGSLSAVDDPPAQSESRISDPRGSAVGYVAEATLPEYRVRNARVDDLLERVAHYTQTSHELLVQIGASVQREDALPHSDRGWPLSVAGAGVAIGIALEFSPTLMTAQALMSLSQSAQWYVATVVIATTAALPLCLGELLRRKREPMRDSLASRAVLITVLVLNVLSLCAGHIVRATQAGASEAFPLGPAGIEAVSLTFVAAAGTALVAAAGTRRESFEAFRSRNLLARLRRDLAWSEIYLRAAQRDLDLALGTSAEAREARTLHGLEQRADEPSEPEGDRRK